MKNQQRKETFTELKKKGRFRPNELNLKSILLETVPGFGDLIRTINPLCLRKKYINQTSGTDPVLKPDLNTPSPPSHTRRGKGYPRNWVGDK